MEQTMLALSDRLLVLPFPIQRLGFGLLLAACLAVVLLVVT